MTKSHLRIGTGGVPLSSKSSSTADGVVRSRELGFDHMEIEFVHGVRMKREKAELVGRIAKENDISLTAHGPYYVNLASLEEDKRINSRRYIRQTAEACHFLGARSFTFHAAYYQKRGKQMVYDIVKEQLMIVVDELHEMGIENFHIRPELTGKGTQFGDLHELIKLSQEIPEVSPCIDFAHAHARSGGAQNTPEEFAKMLDAYADGLGKDALLDMHMHLSGIKYSEKGERNHLPFPDADMDWKGLLDVLYEYGVGGVLVCESPVMEKDAALLKEYWDALSQ